MRVNYWYLTAALLAAVASFTQVLMATGSYARAVAETFSVVMLVALGYLIARG